MHSAKLVSEVCNNVAHRSVVWFVRCRDPFGLTFDNALKIVGTIAVARHIRGQSSARLELFGKKVDLVQEQDEVDVSKKLSNAPSGKGTETLKPPTRTLLLTMLFQSSKLSSIRFTRGSSART